MRCPVHVRKSWLRSAAAGWFGEPLVLSSRPMNVPRTLLAIVVVAVAILGPTLFMASSPCLDCDGVCGAAATHAPVEVRAVLLVRALRSDVRARVPATPVLLSELPPRPLFTTV